MAGRYQYTQRNTDRNKRFRKFNTTIYPKTEPSDDDVYITSAIGDRLDLLADRYYNDVTLWWIIAEANSIGQGTLNIKPGTRLRIPQNIDVVFSSLETINRSR